MKNILLLSLLLVACSDANLDSGLTGKWRITWIMNEGIRTGDLILNNNNTGEIHLQKDAKSAVLPDAENIKIKWSCSNDDLTLTRIDNSFILNYQIKNRTQNSIDLSFVSDINILLRRQ